MVEKKTTTRSRTKPEFDKLRRGYVKFKNRAIKHDVYKKFVEHCSSLERAGYKRSECNSKLIPLWLPLLDWLDDGNSKEKWDYERFKPLGSNVEGAYEGSEVTIHRVASLSLVVQLDENLKILEESEIQIKNQNSKTFVNRGSMVTDKIKKLKLRNPNPNATRKDEVDWAHENLYLYSTLLIDKEFVEAKKLMENAPNYQACAWLEYAHTSPGKFMSELHKLSPQKEPEVEDDASDKRRLIATIKLMEDMNPLTCPECEAVI